MNITAPAAVLLVGSTMQLTASDSAGFTSSDSSVATVDSSGLVTGVAAGSVTITAISLSDATQTATWDLTVTAAVAGAPLVSITAVVAKATELEKLESLIDKLELVTAKEVKAAIAFIRAL